MDDVTILSEPLPALSTLVITFTPSLGDVILNEP